MRIEKVSLISGKVNAMDIDVTDEQLMDWRKGELIQDAMPNTTDVEREFIMTGVTPEEWNSLFGSEE